MWLEAVPAGWFRFPFDAAIIACVSVPLWVLVTYLGPQTPKDTLHKFYLRVRPGGPGWRRIAQDTGQASSGGVGMAVLGVVAGTLGIYGVLLGSGYLLIGDYPSAIGGLVVGLSGLGYAVWRVHIEGQDAHDET